MDSYNFNPKEVYKLSTRGIGGYVALSDLQQVSRAISKSHREGTDLVLLDGLEYLIARSGFDSVYSFIQEMRFIFLESGGVLLIPLNLDTIDRREGVLLQSELELIT